MHPHIYLTANPVENLRSLDNVRSAIRSNRPAALWHALHGKATREAEHHPWTPRTPLPERPASAVKHADREYALIGMTANRMLDGALTALLTDDRPLAQSVLLQIDSIYDTDAWPRIEAISHLRCGDHCSLRRGQLAFAIGLAYDWLHGLWTPDEKQRCLEGFDRRFTGAFRVAHEEGDRFTRMHNNFVPTIYGGFAIAAMAFGEDYEHAAWLLSMCRPRMTKYASGLFGPEGEFPENVNYAGSTASLANYLMAERYSATGSDTPFTDCGFDRFARWYIHCTLPPGRVAGFGDGHADAPPALYHLAALAASLRDPVAQWFYLQYAEKARTTHRKRALELLYLDPSVPSEPPDNTLPLGRVFSGTANIVTSRSSWDPQTPTSVVYGKADLEHNHCHADWGQLCIDGYGERLIVDLGSPSPGYPLGPTSQHYNYQQFGHNVFTFDRPELGGTPMDERDRHGHVVKSEFDARGGTWTFDLTDVYAPATRVTRHVIHLLPRIVAVLDDAELQHECPVSLRWHTASEPQLGQGGGFFVRNHNAALAAHIRRIDGDATLSVGRHAYQPPNNLDRRGEPLDQRHEPYVELTCHASHCRILTLFHIHEPTPTPPTWQESENTWTTITPEGHLHVTLTDAALCIENGCNTIVSEHREFSATARSATVEGGGIRNPGQRPRSTRTL